MPRHLRWLRLPLRLLLWLLVRPAPRDALGSGREVLAPALVRADFPAWRCLYWVVGCHACLPEHNSPGTLCHCMRWGFNRYGVVETIRPAFRPADWGP